MVRCDNCKTEDCNLLHIFVENDYGGMANFDLCRSCYGKLWELLNTIEENRPGATKLSESNVE